MTVNFPSIKALTPDQEAEIARRLATATRLSDDRFPAVALKHGWFTKWFRQRYVAEPTLEKITPEVRAAFMVDWERGLREEYAAENERQAKAAENDDDDPDDTPPPRRRVDENNDDRVQEDEDDEESDDVRTPNYSGISGGTGGYYHPPSTPDPNGLEYDPFTNSFKVASPLLVETTPDQIQERQDLHLKKDDPRVRILRGWLDMFKQFPMQQEWYATHRLDVVVVDNAGIMGVALERSPDAVVPEGEAWEKMESYTARTLRQLAEHGPKVSQPIDVDDAPDSTRYVIEGLFPYGLSMVYGDDGACKSLFLQKAGLTVADESGTDFEGLATEHGRVVYGTFDLNASADDIRPGVREIRKRLGLAANGRMTLRDPPLYLDDPASVTEFLDNEARGGRLPAKMIVIDSLHNAVTQGKSTSQDTVIGEAISGGVRQLLRECDAVVIAHHSTRDDVFGSRFIQAATGATFFIEKDGKSNRVTVTTKRMKFDGTKEGERRVYTREGPYLRLDSGPGTGARSAGPAPTTRADLVARLPLEWTPLADARAAVKETLSDSTWTRLCDEWSDAGKIERKGRTKARMIRRVAS